MAALPPRPTRLLALVFACAGAGCATPPPASAPAPVARADAPPPPERRVGPACADAIEHVRAEPADPTIEPARPDSLFLPPLPVPEAAKGAVVHIVVAVTEEGRVMQGSLQMDASGVPRDYRRRLEGMVGTLHFVPAGYQGCAVPGLARLTYELR